MQKVFGFGFGVNPSKKPLSRSSKHECHRQSKLPNDHFSRCFQHRTWCGLISSSGWWTALPSVLCIKISQWHRETLCHSWKRSPCNNKGWWEVLWLRAQHPFHPRNWSQTTYCTPEYIRTLKDAPPYPFFPPETYEIQLLSPICTRKTSSHCRYTLMCSCWPAQARR